MAAEVHFIDGQPAHPGTGTLQAEKHSPLDLIFGPFEFVCGEPLGCHAVEFISHDLENFVDGLGPEGRAIVFVVLESLDPNQPVTYDPEWTFELSVKGPDGSDVEVDLTQSVPRSWASDPGVRMIAGFDSIAKGTHLVTVTSPNCPRSTASMIVLPIN